MLPSFAEAVPYQVLLVELADHPFRMIGAAHNDQPLQIGAAVEVRFENLGGWSRPVWRDSSTIEPEESP